MTAWSGRGVATVSADKVTQAVIPLPLGIMQVKELFDSHEAVIIDSRDRRAFAEGHISGALSLPLGEADGLIPDLMKRFATSAMLVVYCSGYACEDSVDLGKKLIAAGFGAVYYFEGGFPAWKDAGYPTARVQQ
jgi:rhodanese-related sulfurtransferase